MASNIKTFRTHNSKLDDKNETPPPLDYEILSLVTFTLPHTN